MIKTLRMTGVAAVLFAGVVLASLLGPVSLVRLDDRGDEKISKVLGSPGAVERSQELHAGKDRNPDTTPPLVKQAELFKDIIDPKPVAPAGDATRVAQPPNTPPRPPSSTQQDFALLGTACSPSNPSSSFAYIRFVDNTCLWVGCGEEVGHLVVKEIREDSIIYWDGRRESELPIQAVPDRVSLLEADGDVPASTPATRSQPIEVKMVDTPASRLRPAGRPVPPMTGGAQRLTPEEQQRLDELADKLRRMHGAPDDGPDTDANRAAAVNRLISEFKSSRVSPEETVNLENLPDEAPDEKEQGRDEQKRELMRKLNTARPPRR